MVPFRYSFRSLLARRAPNLGALFGVAAVVFVLAASMMLTTGIERTFARAGSPDVAIVTRGGAGKELDSWLEASIAPKVVAQPGVVTDGRGPVAAAELYAIAQMKKRGEERFANVVLRGVEARSGELRPGFRVVEGREARPGTNEAVVGRRAAGKFVGSSPGERIEVRPGRGFDIVGVFEQNGSSMESEVWIDRRALADSIGRSDAISAVRVRLASPAAFAAFRAALEAEKSLDLQAATEPAYYEGMAASNVEIFGALGGIIGAFASLGAMLGVVILMSAGVTARRREIGTLRALGFPRRAVLLGLLAESIALTVCGGVLGVAAASCLQFVQLTTMNYNSFSEVVLRLELSPKVLGTSVGIAFALGLLAGVLPALHAARMPVLGALREGR